MLQTGNRSSTNLGLYESEWTMGNGSLGGSHELPSDLTSSFSLLNLILATLSACLVRLGNSGIIPSSGSSSLVLGIVLVLLLGGLGVVFKIKSLLRSPVSLLDSLLAVASSIGFVSRTLFPSMVRSWSLLGWTVCVPLFRLALGTRTWSARKTLSASLARGLFVAYVGISLTVWFHGASRPSSVSEWGVWLLLAWLYSRVALFVHALLHYLGSRYLLRRWLTPDASPRSYIAWSASVGHLHRDLLIHADDHSVELRTRRPFATSRLHGLDTSPRPCRRHARDRRLGICHRIWFL